MIKGGSVKNMVSAVWRYRTIALIVLFILVLLRLVWFCPHCHRPMIRGGGISVYSTPLLSGTKNFVGCHNCADSAGVDFEEKK